MKDMEADVVRSSILKTGMRIDGRDTKTVRPIVAEVGLLPRTHGSSLFTRGETQALVVSTLGTGQDEQIIDALTGESRARFMLHYNFPPYSVGEAGRVDHLVGVRLVTENWHGGQLIPCCHQRTSFPIPFGSSQKSPNQMVHLQWRRCAEPRLL